MNEAQAGPGVRESLLWLAAGLAGAVALAAAVMGLGQNLGLGHLGSVLLFVWGFLVLTIAGVVYSLPRRVR